MYISSKSWLELIKGLVNFTELAGYADLAEDDTETDPGPYLIDPDVIWPFSSLENIMGSGILSADLAFG